MHRNGWVRGWGWGWGMGNDGDGEWGALASARARVIGEVSRKTVRETGRPTRVLLLSQPNNPLGVCYPTAVVEDCID